MSIDNSEDISDDLSKSGLELIEGLRRHRSRMESVSWLLKIALVLNASFLIWNVLDGDYLLALINLMGLIVVGITMVFNTMLRDRDSAIEEITMMSLTYSTMLKLSSKIMADLSEEVKAKDKEIETLKADILKAKTV